MKKLSIVFLFFLSFSLQAEQFQIIAFSENKPEKAFGVIFDSGKTELVNDAQISLLSSEHNLYSISFEATSSAKSHISAILVDQNSNKTYSTVFSASSAKSSTLNLKSCEPFKDAPDMSSQTQLISELIKVRTKIKESSLGLINNLLDSGTLDLLKLKEVELGSAYQKELSTNLPPAELNMRLFKLLNAINNS